MEVSGQLHVPPALPPGKEPLVSMDRRMGESQTRSGRGGEEKNFYPLPGLEPLITQAVAQRYTTELCRVLSVGLTRRNVEMKSDVPTIGKQFLYLLFFVAITDNRNN
jgi:hypothetical protein